MTGGRNWLWRCRRRLHDYGLFRVAKSEIMLFEWIDFHECVRPFFSPNDKQGAGGRFYRGFDSWVF